MTVFKSASKSLTVGCVVAAGVAVGVASGMVTAVAVGVAAAMGVVVDAGVGLVVGVLELVCSSGFGSGTRICGAGMRLKAIAATAKLETPIVAGTACFRTS